MGKAFELWIAPEDSGEQILAKVMEAVQRFKKESYLRRRFIDTSTLEAIGPYVDWRSLVKCAKHQLAGG